MFKLLPLLSALALAAAPVSGPSLAAQPAKASASKQPAKTAKKAAPKPHAAAGKTSSRTRAKSRATAGKTSNKARAKTAANGSQASQKQGLEQQQKSLQAQIGKLQKNISQNQAKKKQEAAAAASAKKALDASNQKLERLSSETQKTRTALAGIRQESGRVAGRLAETRRDISANAKLRYLHANKTAWQTVLAGTSPVAASRNEALLAYLAQSHQKKADTLEDTQGQLQNAEKQTSRKAQSLTAATATEKASNKQIAAGQELHEANAKQLDAQIEQQKKQVKDLRRDQQRLASLIQRINLAIAAQEKARKKKLERERLERKRKAEEAKRRAEQAGKPAPKPAPKEIPEEEPPTSVASGSFAKLRGRLPMPASGRIAAGFGQSRNGAGTWQGLMIRAALNSPVKAVADGTVVYSGNLRGYGNLMILDHGDGYLSVYAYNNALLKGNGAKVKAGETIARVGPGENGDEPGLYFEIRSQGKPVNPRPWLR